MGIDYSFNNRRDADRVERLMDKLNDCPVEIRAKMTQFVELVSIALIVSTDEEAAAMMTLMDADVDRPEDQLQQIQQMAMHVLHRYRDSLRVALGQEQEQEQEQEDIIVVSLPFPPAQPLPPRAEGDDDRARPCKFCGSYHLAAVEYRGTSEDYDGTSEWACQDCGRREGRWSHRELFEGELEPRYGLPLRKRN